MIDFPIIDTHLHLWDPKLIRYPWLDGKPFIKERSLEPWKSLLKDYASLPNTWCKISGLVTEADFKTTAKARPAASPASRPWLAR